MHWREIRAVVFLADMAESTLTPEVIEEQALKARAMTVDGQQLTRRSMDELIAARQAAGSSRATAKKGLGLFFQKIEPGGAG